MTASHPDLQLLPGHGDHGRAAGAAQRFPDHDDRLRQCAVRARSRCAGIWGGCWPSLRRSASTACSRVLCFLDRARLSQALAPTVLQATDLPKAARRRPHDDLSDAQQGCGLGAAVAELEARRSVRSDPALRHIGRRLRRGHGADRLAVGVAGLGLTHSSHFSWRTQSRSGPIGCSGISCPHMRVTFPVSRAMLRRNRGQDRSSAAERKA